VIVDDQDVLFIDHAAYCVYGAPPIAPHPKAEGSSEHVLLKVRAPSVNKASVGRRRGSARDCIGRLEVQPRKCPIGTPPAEPPRPFQWRDQERQWACRAGLAISTEIARPAQMRPGLLRASFRFLTGVCVGLLGLLSLLPAQDMVRTCLPGPLEHFVAYAGSGRSPMAGYGLNRGAAAHLYAVGPFGS
jgi:hypothetical protein